ncbi:MAG: hypothetical protein NZ529_01470 [Cytophagaceae bacterium]|nr:hypothetical protein [Cytophagaceae bacterium]MDW8455435.1 hypothetical protein [Cytophagaceae bacterium]
MLEHYVQLIVELQNKQPAILPARKFIPVDITLFNGNITLKSFVIINISGRRITGLTQQEQYTAPRENREPVYSSFGLDEIKCLYCAELDIDYKHPGLD